MQRQTEKKEWSQRSKRYKVNYFAALGQLFGESNLPVQEQDQNTVLNSPKTELQGGTFNYFESKGKL